MMRARSNGRSAGWARWLLWPVLCGLALNVALVAAQGDRPGKVVLLRVRGVIDPIVAQYVEQGIRTAGREGADAVIIQLDTPGGLDTAMRTVVQAILASDIPVVVYVAPSGARAASAGVFIAMAAHVIAMAPGTNIGAAHPVTLGREDTSATMKDKMTNDAAAYLRSLAEHRGRNAEWAEQAVRESTSLTAQQAMDRGVVDLVSRDLGELLRQLDGREITCGENRIALSLADAEVERRPMNILQAVAHGIVDPNIAYLLLSLGTIALIAEFYHPGAIIPGVTGVISLILAFVAMGSLPVNWGGIALIVVAFAFFILDIKVAGFALSVAGAISFVLGSLLLFSPFTPVPPAMPRLRVNPWLVTGMTALLVGFFGFALTAGLRAQRRAVMVGGAPAVGSTGVAVSDLDPHGVVRIRSETWSATAVADPIRAGERVAVVAAEGLRLRVRSIADDTGAESQGQGRVLC